MQNLSLELAKALFGACLLVGHSFASAKAISFSESQTTTHCLFIEQLELADLEAASYPSLIGCVKHLWPLSQMQSMEHALVQTL